MDWSSLGPAAGKLARIGLPKLGQILGDLVPFPGGSMIGGMLGDWAGNAVANALGVPATPEDVGAAIQNMPAGELQARLAPIESEAAAKWNALAEMHKADAADRTAQSQAINQTIAAEAGTVSWWHWRHLIGYLVLVYGLQQIALSNLVVLGWTKVTMDQLAQLFNSQAILTGGLFALLGFVANDTTKRTVALATGEKPDGIIASTIKKIKGK